MLPRSRCARFRRLCVGTSSTLIRQASVWWYASWRPEPETSSQSVWWSLCHCALAWRCKGGRELEKTKFTLPDQLSTCSLFSPIWSGRYSSYTRHMIYRSIPQAASVLDDFVRQAGGANTSHTFAVLLFENMHWGAYHEVISFWQIAQRCIRILGRDVWHMQFTQCSELCLFYRHPPCLAVDTNTIVCEHRFCPCLLTFHLVLNMFIRFLVFFLHSCSTLFAFFLILDSLTLWPFLLSARWNMDLPQLQEGMKL